MGADNKSNKGEKADLFLLGREDDTLVLLLEPLLGIVLLDLVVESDAGLGSSALGDALSGAVEDDVEVHTVDTDGGIVLKTKIDVLVNTEAKVSGGAEVVVKQLELLDTETLLDELEGLGTTDGGVDGDLLVTADTELSDGVASFFGFVQRDEGKELISLMFLEFDRRRKLREKQKEEEKVCGRERRKKKTRGKVFDVL